MAKDPSAPREPVRWSPRRRRGASDAVVPKPRRRGLLWLALSLAVGLVTLALLGLGAAVWLLRSEPGTAWLLPQLPGVETRGVRGALWGEFAADQMVIHLPDNGRLVLTDVGWRDVRVERAAGSGQWLRLYFGELRAARGELRSPTREGRASAPPPSDLRLPLELEVGTLRVGELRSPGLGDPPLRELSAHLHLGAEAGALHRVELLGAAWDKLRASGSAQIATTAPLALQARIELAQEAVAELPAWSAQATLAGPLAAPQLEATLRARPQASKPAQSLDARATLKPFAAWPLGDLQASARALDLSAFHSAAPATVLHIDARATTRGLDQPASVSISAGNQAPGRWNEGRLPLRSLTLELSARPDDPGTLEVQRFEAELGNARQPAGRVGGSGRWSAARWNLAATLDALQPDRLDARAPAMRFSGPVEATGGAASTAIEVKADLAGALAQRGPARAVQLGFEAGFSALRIELRTARARAGGASATLSGSLTRSAADAPWRSVGQAKLVNFDPLPWWPGSDASPWRKGPHRINASASFDLGLPALDRPGSVAERLAALRGQAEVQIAPSVLAGVALTGSATLRNADAAAAALATVALDAEGNKLRAQGRIDTRRGGAGDAWDLTLEAPALARLAPVYRLLQPAGADPGFAGSANASAKVAGRWPALTSEGQLEASGLRIGAAQVQRAEARWQVGTSANAPVEARIALQQATIAGQSIDSALLQLKGTARAHTLDLRAESKGRPPAWVDTLQPGAAPPAAAGTSAVLQAEGGLFDAGGAGAGAAGWRGRLRQVELRPLPGGAPWLRSGHVAMELQWAGGPTRARIEPGRAELLGAALRWTRIDWQAADAGGGAARIEARAELEPLRVAPLLARFQPDFGWGGDLTVAGRLDIGSANGFHAEVVVERAQGDLTVTEEAATRSLGLTDLRLALSARNGVWSFTQAAAGSTLGVLAGAVVANASPRATWPAADAPIQGVLELQVANLGTWGAWVPPGWRLAGRLRAGAAISGRFGAPEYTGQVVGSELAVRNFLEGVNISDGDVAIALQGTSARIERFTAKAGSGTVRLQGGASLGEAPKADLALMAERFQVLGRVDRRIVASGQGRLQLDRDNVNLTGQFDIDEGLIDFSRGDAPALSDDVVVTRGTRVQPNPSDAAEARAAAPAAARPGARKVALDLRVGLGRQLRLRGRGIDTLLQGELRATAPLGRLAVNGTVQTEGGTYAAYGQKLAIDRGRISFSGPVENPRLDIEATRPNLDIRVGVAVSGGALNPRVRLFSEPEMSDVDKLSWLVLGRASDGLGRTETALLQRAAMALLAGEGPGMTDQLIKAIGLDELSVRQTNGEVRETVVSLGKQLSRRWYVGYERSLNTTTGTWQLVYRIARRFTLRAKSGLDNSLDLIWTWRWQ